MALSDAIAALFGWRRVVVYDHSVVAATIQGMDAYAMYRKQPALRAVVSFIADNVAGIPLKCYERRGDADRPRDTGSDLARLLTRPCSGMTTHELVRATISDYLLVGDALWFVYDDEDAPSGRWVRYIPWSWVCGKETLDGFEPSVYRVSNPYTGYRADLPAEDCIRFFSYDPRGTMDSSSAIEALKDVLSEQLSAWEYRNGVWKNGGRVSQWISRPANSPWEPGARDRFAKSWKARFAGKDATDTGGTPLLEDGMRLETTTFNAREAQWQEATRLAREDVAAVYHVNPSLIWHTDGQTYASAKDNARALYADTLTPLLDMVEKRLNGFLVPMLGMDPATHYCEFDLSSKLAASFEEQASVLQSSVGGPWMLRNEARARMNLPALEGGDELIVPLNVSEGGLAAPNDTDPTVERYNARPALDVHVEPVAKGGDAVPFGPSASTKDAEVGSVVLLKSSAEPPDDLVEEMQAAMERFLERQSRRVLQDIERGEQKARKAEDGYPWWWDMVRWNRELADDLEPLFRRICDLRGVSAMADIGEDASRWDSARTANFVRAMAERRADLFNEATYQVLVANMMEFEVGDPRRITAAERSFLDHARNRAVRGARTFATAVCGFATKEAVRQVYPMDTDTVRRTKTWRHHGSKQPRSAHAAMDGETVGLDERFSNGADYPGDLGLPAEESVNCRCTMDVGVKRRGVSESVSASNRDIERWYSQFENEELWATLADGSPFYKEGVPNTVPLTEEEVALLENAQVKHIHTSTIDGTFSGDDIDLTTRGWLASHEVEGTLTGRTYRLVRLPEATKESAAAFCKQFEILEEYYGQVFEEEEWEVRDAPFGLPTSVESAVEAQKRVKALLDEWLIENAGDYGYVYSSQ